MKRFGYGNNNNNNIKRFGYGNNACFDAGAFNNQASSLRYTGAPDDMFHDTVNIIIVSLFGFLSLSSTSTAPTGEHVLQ